MNDISRPPPLPVQQLEWEIRTEPSAGSIVAAVLFVGFNLIMCLSVAAQLVGIEKIVPIGAIVQLIAIWLVVGVPLGLIAYAARGRRVMVPAGR